MSERPVDVAATEAPRPRDSSSAIVLVPDTDGSGFRVLLGVRSRKSRFMPGHLAFPGGGVEPADRPGEAGAFARCAARELREETGLDVPSERWVEAGERITPAMFPVRFRTKFFVTRVEPGDVPAHPVTSENERLVCERPDRVVASWQRGEAKVPPPVLPILRALVHGSASVAEASARVGQTNALEEQAPRIEFSPGLWMVPLRTRTLLPATHTNAWMPGRGRFAVIDPGTDEDDEFERLLRVVARRSAAGGSPECVLLTHHHRDHVGSAARLASRLGIPVLAHAATLERLRLPPGVDARALEDGARLELDGTELHAIHTPGHAAGHLAFHLPRERILIAGDLVSGISTIVVDPDDGTMDDYLASLERVRDLNCRLLLPAHGPPLPSVALQRVIDHRLRREEQVEASLASGKDSVEAIAAAVYADTRGASVALGARQTLAHLLRLERAGRAERLRGEPGRWRASGAVSPASTPERIRSLLADELDPQHLEIDDESHRHVGHPGASGGGGHFRLILVSESFRGLSRIEQHRRVYRILGELLRGGAIHALALETRTPEEWQAETN